MTRILVFGKTPQIMPRVLSKLENEGFEVDGVLTAEEAIAKLARGGFDAVAIGGGVGDDERATVHRSARAIPVVDVYGPENLVRDVRAALRL
jgi:DNA-binding response OmpR family regulator